MIKYEHAKLIETILEGDYRLTILKELKVFSSKIKEFDSSFLESCEATLQSKNKISAKQFNSLVNIYNSFNVYQTLNPIRQGKTYGKY